jgi:hypothetical protein
VGAILLLWSIWSGLKAFLRARELQKDFPEKAA